ncbi:MAG: hypothetical protein K1000chlam4_00192 [Chlamydiae bacterium]|nr:hypothetical protein [Chlamydiota bacterium]
MSFSISRNICSGASRALNTRSHAVVFGNGLIGSESVQALVKSGIPVTWAARRHQPIDSNHPSLTKVQMDDFFEERSVQALFQGLKGKEITLINTIGVPQKAKINTFAPFLVRTAGHLLTSQTPIKMLNLSTMMVHWQEKSKRSCSYAQQMKEEVEEIANKESERIGLPVVHLRLDQVIEPPVEKVSEDGKVEYHLPSKHPFSMQQLALSSAISGVMFDIGRAAEEWQLPKTQPVCLTDIIDAVTAFSSTNYDEVQSKTIHAVGPKAYSPGELTHILVNFISGKNKKMVEIPLPLSLMKSAVLATGDMGKLSLHAVEVLKMNANIAQQPTGKELSKLLKRPLTNLEEVFDPNKSKGAKVVVSAPPVAALARQTIKMSKQNPTALASFFLKAATYAPWILANIRIKKRN